jgi:hypothetical protein
MRRSTNIAITSTVTRASGPCVKRSNYMDGAHSKFGVARRAPRPVCRVGRHAALLMIATMLCAAQVAHAAVDISKYLPYPHLQQLMSPPSGDPIGPIAAQMKDVGGDLSVMKTDAPVQTKQKNVTVALDSVIKELEQQCKSGNGGTNPNPTKPMSRSVLAKGPGGSGPLHDAVQGTRVWGQLPPKDRDQILQSRTEGFPAGYDSVLANYYSRLAQEQVGNDAGADRPTTQPSGQ